MDLVSQCALRVAKVVWRPGHGGFAFTVVCKATFELRPDVSPLAGEQVPVELIDVYGGEGPALTVASDLVPVKKRPEVLLTGHAYAPEGRPTPSVLARLVVGEIDKSIQVVGDRHFGRNGRLSDPEYFTGMPLVWERADGGPDTFNPAGRSLGSAARPDALGRVLAPNLLPPGLQLRSRSDTVPPVGFGPIAPRWPSRLACLHQHAAGWDPGRWHEQPLPADIDLGYFNAAPTDQQRTLPFGEEVIYLENLHPRFPQLSTRLAPVALAATVDHGAGSQALQLRCDTLIIDTDRGLAMLVWRAHVLLDHPDRPGRVVVTDPGAVRASILEWAARAGDPEATMVPNLVKRAAAVLPFAPAAPFAPTQAVRTRLAAIHMSSSDEDGPTLRPGFNPPVTAVLPFVVARGESTPRSDAPPVQSASALPFTRSSGPEEEDGPATARRLDLRASAPVLPWAAPPMEPPRVAAVSPSTGYLPFSPAVDEPPLAALSPVTGGAPASAGVSESPVQPPLLGPIAIPPEAPSPARETERPPAAPGEGEVVEPEPEVAFEAYPPQRCGAIAARLACDEGEALEILRAEDLDGGRWQRVHAHWLDRIRDEVARGRKKLLSDYDGAYVGALESRRGPIALEEYARFAEAAERGAAVEALAAHGLTEKAWPHIHRVWIGRTVKDVQLGKRLRAAIDALRAVDRDESA